MIDSTYFSLRSQQRKQKDKRQHLCNNCHIILILHKGSKTGNSSTQPEAEYIKRNQIDCKYNKKLSQTIDRSQQTSSDNHAQDNIDVYHN